jgi:hypothetical protein
MKTAVIRLGSALAGVTALSSLFLAAPAFASYNSYQYTSAYGYYPQQQVTNVCSSRFDYNCILEETQVLTYSNIGGYNHYPYAGYDNGYYPSSVNQYNNTYDYRYSNYNGYESNGEYGNQYNYNNSYSYNSNQSYGYNYQYQYQYGYQY